MFSLTGSGTIVTGTLPAGTVRTGDELLLTPAGRPVRIRDIESLNEKVGQARGVARVAVNLRGVAPGQLARGMALVEPGGWTLTATIDVKLAGPRGSRDDGPEPRLPRQVTVHIGSARTTARVRPLGGPFARLTLREPLPLHVADRLLLRDPGAARAAHGAPVAPGAEPGAGPWPAIVGATVLDVSLPGAPRRGAAAAVRAELAGWTDPPAVADLLRRRGLARPAELRAMGLPVPAGRGRPGSQRSDRPGLARLRHPARPCHPARLRHPARPGQARLRCRQPDGRRSVSHR